MNYGSCYDFASYVGHLRYNSFPYNENEKMRNFEYSVSIIEV